MPIPRTCPHSGAVIFDLTPEEEQQKEMLDNYPAMLKQMAQMQKQLDAIQKQTTEGSGE